MMSSIGGIGGREGEGVVAIEGMRPVTTAAAHGETTGSSRRIGGTTWQPERPIPADEFAGSVSLPVAVPRARRRRRQRRWYRRPVIVAPVLLAALVLGLVGAVLLRAESMIAKVQSVSSAPPVVALADEEGASGAPVVSVDTAPAQAALEEAGGGAEAPADGGGLFGDFKEKAGNVKDIAGGAAAAAGITDPAAGTMNILVMGVDARPGAPIDIGVKADAIAVLNLDPAARSCRFLSVPRDTRTELPGYGQSKVNHALLVGGIPYQRLVIEKLLGISLDHYALVDFAGFQELVDAVGGVTVTIPEAVTGPGGVGLEPGNQTLDGAQALAYARYRDGVEGDIGRVKRQWGILRGLLAATEGRDLVRDVNRLLPPLTNHIRTDLTATQLATIAESFGGACTEQTMGTAALAGTQVRLEDPMLKQTVYYNVVDEALIRERVAELVGA
ncbi:MAG: polyisoprenyl-teichoic acid--peptidoglycan teichoic acid transferase [Thermomicrobiales bacterium]|nr:polyisoprenyl-teichoic acid--peptidoglycan teichoic acid transferase [Thermomicrobiales bacterium]